MIKYSKVPVVSSSFVLPIQPIVQYNRHFRVIADCPEELAQNYRNLGVMEVVMSVTRAPNKFLVLLFVPYNGNYLQSIILTTAKDT